MLHELQEAFGVQMGAKTATGNAELMFCTAPTRQAAQSWKQTMWKPVSTLEIKEAEGKH